MKFNEYVQDQMSQFYFKFKIIRSIDNPLLQIECKNTAIKCVILPSLTKNNELCYTAISNNQLTLNRNGGFNACDNLNMQIGD